MTEEQTSPSSSAEDVAPAPRSFPVPRNRPVLPPLDEFEEVEHDDGTGDEPTRHRRALEIMLILALTAIITLVWLITRPAEKTVPAAPVVEVRTPTDDPAVETYFTPSQPEELPPVVDDRTPLPPPVSLDDLFGSEER